VIRAVETDADIEAWLQVRRVVLPNESAGTVEQFRARRRPEQLALLAENDGVLAGSGLAGLSDAPGRGFVSPRVLPEARRQGIGSALLERPRRHVATLGVAGSARTSTTTARARSPSASASRRSTVRSSRCGRGAVQAADRRRESRS
jgi:GNAT superfamily N-acetyltransferase